MKSPFLNLDTKDFLKGLLLVVLTSVITIIQESLNQGSLSFDWKAIGTTALTAGLAYMLKNLLSNSDGKFLKSEDPKI